MPELVRIMADCKPAVVIHSPCFAAVVDQLRPYGGQVRFPSSMRAKRLQQPRASTIRPIRRPRRNRRSREVTLGDPLLIMFMSGTTGTLKGAVLSHENFLFGAIQNLRSYGIDATFVSLVVAPLFHIGALVASATPVIYAGGALVIRDFDNPSEILHLIAKEKINYMFAVPVMYKMMSKAPAWEGADFSHVRFFIAGGAPMPVSLIRQYQEKKGVRFVQGYGSRKPCASPPWTWMTLDARPAPSQRAFSHLGAHRTMPVGRCQPRPPEKSSSKPHGV